MENNYAECDNGETGLTPGDVSSAGWLDDTSGANAAGVCSIYGHPASEVAEFVDGLHMAFRVPITNTEPVELTFTIGGADRTKKILKISEEAGTTVELDPGDLVLNSVVEVYYSVPSGAAHVGLGAWVLVAIPPQALNAQIAAAVGAKANIDSPEFAGVPLAPTVAALTDTDQLATTAFVKKKTACSMLTFYNGWGAGPVGQAPCVYVAANGRVYMHGYVTPGVVDSWTVMFNINSPGFRPSAVLRFAASNGASGLSGVRLDPNGDVVLVNWVAGSTLLSLDGISFDPEYAGN